MKTEAHLDSLFQATAEATEEAILNSSFKASTLEGRDRHLSESIQIEKTVNLLRKHERI
jgi:D-aminopeptidase